MFERHRIGLQDALEQAGEELRSQLLAVADWFLPTADQFFEHDASRYAFSK